VSRDIGEFVFCFVATGDNDVVKADVAVAADAMTIPTIGLILRIQLANNTNDLIITILMGAGRKFNQAR